MSESDSPPTMRRQPRHTFLAFTLAVGLFSIVAAFTLSPSFSRKIHRRILRPVYALSGRIPLPSGFSAPSNLGVAVRSFSAYSHTQQAALDKKWRAFERMPGRHRKLGNLLDWKATLEKTEDAVETNSVVTDQIATLGMDLARRDGVPLGMAARTPKLHGRVVETLKHFVRDWSEEGKSERDVLFPPILDALQDAFPESKGRKVLVPGCGLGRLAYDIADIGFSTDANDYSHFMNLGSSLIFKATQYPSQHTLSPWIHLFSHQRTSENMLRQVSFPDVVPNKTLDLTFKPGDFKELFREKEVYDAVVTLFFIDTASNILEYFETIYNALKPGGVWINEGPLLYWGQPGMELPLEDVVRLAELVGFKVERRLTLKEARYTGDELGMYTFAYDCEFWLARKPEAKRFQQ
ncbi:hypothetical protein JCM11251_000561 [Rhodosporidiobolus azoricus]